MFGSLLCVLYIAYCRVYISLVRRPCEVVPVNPRGVRVADPKVHAGALLVLGREPQRAPCVQLDRAVGLADELARAADGVVVHVGVAARICEATGRVRVTPIPLVEVVQRGVQTEAAADAGQ